MNAKAVQKQSQRILGIDPGLNVTGYGILETTGAGLSVCEAGVIHGRSRNSLTQRVLEIHEGVVEIIQSFTPHVLALEELYSHYQRPRTAILMGHARGVICLAAAQHGMTVRHYPATKVKKIISGNGHAPKAQIQLAVQRELGLRTIPEPHDVADALAVALCHYYLNQNVAEKNFTTRSVGHQKK